MARLRGYCLGKAYFEAAAQGRDDLAAEARNIELWANIEAFAGATALIVWYDADWQLHSQQIDIGTEGYHDPDLGKNDPTLPDRLEAVWVPFDWSASLAPDFWVHLSITTGAGQATHRYSLEY